MSFNFDEVIDRKNTGSVKWDFYGEVFSGKDLLPMWVADMDFRVPEAVIEAVIKKAQHGIYGYTEGFDSYYQAIINWVKRRHNWKIKKEWIFDCPGVVPAMHWAVRTFTHPGDKVILQSPVYYPFFKAIKNGGCQVVNNPLKLDNSKYSMDFADLESKIDSRVKMFILCHPHNPGGIVWSKEELTRLGEICIKNDIIVISDEIHGDLVLSGNKHIPFAAISEDFAMNTITCIAPSKTFNIAGLQASSVIIANPKLQKEFKIILENNAVSEPNIFALTALEAAYNHGDEWLDNLIKYIEENHKLVEDFIAAKIPKLKVIKAQATYLAWIDCRALGMDTTTLEKFVEKEAKLALTQGYVFGEGGEGFVRINLGCPRSVVQEALQRLKKAVDTL